MNAISPENPDQTEDEQGPGAQAHAQAGSHELDLELAISQMRASILRAVIELDRFTVTVRAAREAIEREYPRPHE